MSESPCAILFLCTGNSARSIMAEVIANRRYGSSLRAGSAGSRPKPQPHPLALETLRRHGLPTDEARSTSWDEFANERFDVVITLCDSAARETCPIFPGAPLQVHWGFPDPPAAEDPPAEFERVFLALDETIRMFVTGDGDVETRARAVAEHVARRFPDAQ